MSKRKDEEALKDFFIRFLQTTESASYEVIAENVSNRIGNRDFDYLLRGISGNSTMALEISLISDSDDEFAQRALRDSVESTIRETIRNRSDELPGCIVIEIPHRFSPDIVKKAVQRHELEAESQLISIKIA